MGSDRHLLTALLLAVCSPCGAVEPLDTFSVRAGGYLTRFDTEVRADGRAVEGTRLDLRRDLGLDNSDAIAFVGVTWRPFARHEFGASYYQDSGDAERRARRDFEFNGVHYDTHTQIRTAFDLDSYEAYYIYWAWQRERWALGPRLGLLWYKLDLSLAVDVAVNDDEGTMQSTNQVEGDLPAPTLGGSWRWAPGEQWRLGADAGYFTAEVNDIEADVVFGRLGVEWFPWARWGLSLDYTVRRIEADVRKSRFDGDLRFVDSGLRLGVTYRF